MPPSNRKPTEPQGAVLAALLQRDVDTDGEGHQLHATPDVIATIVEYSDPKAGEKPAKVLEVLQQCRKHEWVECVQQGTLVDGAAPCSHLQWIIADAGVSAHERHLEAPVEAKEPTPAAAEEPPPWGSQRPPAKRDPEPDPASEEEPTVLEGALTIPVEEGSEEPVLAGKENKVVGSQLTMEVGGPKPVTASLVIGSKQISYAHRQFRQLQRIPFSGMLEIREVGSKVPNNGKVVRVHKAIIAELTVDNEIIEGDDA